MRSTNPWVSRWSAMSTRASTRRAPMPRVSPGVPAVPVASRSLTWKIFTAPSAGRCAFRVAIPSGWACSASSRRAAASWCRSSAPSGSTMITACPVTSRSSLVVNVTGVGQHQVLQVLGLFGGQGLAVVGDDPGLRPVQHPLFQGVQGGREGTGHGAGVGDPDTGGAARDPQRGGDLRRRPVRRRLRGCSGRPGRGRRPR